jgi:hypothetical protein
MHPAPPAASHTLARDDNAAQHCSSLSCLSRARMTFQRIVWPDRRREIDGVTCAVVVSVENSDPLICVEKPSQNSASEDQ